MKKEEFKNICLSLNIGDKILVKRKTISMKKYGESIRFIPRYVSYKPFEIYFQRLSDDGTCLIGTNSECIYYSKIGSIQKVNQTT